MTDNDSMINRILALLAKAESTTFDHERNAYLAKAQELQIKHRIDQSKLKKDDVNREGIEKVTVNVGAQYANRVLWNQVAKSQGVSYINSGKGNARVGYLVGFKSDLVFVQSLVSSLMIQREAALGRTERPYNVHGKTWGASFRLGFAHTISKRLREAERVTVNETPGTDIVLVDRRTLVEAEYKRLFPDAFTRTVQVSTRSAAAYGYGSNAARNADLTGGTGTLDRSGQRALN